jgi:nitrate/nitrite-specific signal transduction histidine kinase
LRRTVGILGAGSSVPLVCAGADLVDERLNGCPRPYSDSLVFVQGAEEFSVDRSEWVVTDLSSRGASQRDAAALDAVVAVSRSLAGEADLEAILDSVAKRARALVSARALAVEVRKGNRMAVAAVAGELPGGPVAARESSEGAVLVVPLLLRGCTYGALVAVDPQGEEPRFTIDDEELLETFAALAATSVAVRKLGEAPAPIVLEQFGVAVAIESLADRVEVPSLEIRTKIDLAFEEGRAAKRLPGELETAIFRIVQEALRSAAADPGATRVLVEVAEDDHRGKIRIEVRSSPEQGTTLSAVLPSCRRGRSMLNID